MTYAMDQWPQLFNFFDALHQDFDVIYADKEQCMAEATSQATDEDLREGLRQWHDVFDEASDNEVGETIRRLNPWWDADRLFGGSRAWAEWVREHLERELAAREK